MTARRSKSGDTIIAIISEKAAEDGRRRPGELMEQLCTALNALLESPEKEGPVTVRAPLRLAS